MRGENIKKGFFLAGRAEIPGGRGAAAPHGRCAMSLYELAGLEGPVSSSSSSSCAPASSSSGGSGSTATKDKSARTPKKPTLVPAVGFKPLALAKKPLPPQRETAPPSLVAAVAAAPDEALGVRAWYKDIKQPYDPALPNEYQEWLKERDAKRKAAALEEALRKKQAILEDVRNAAGKTRPPPPPPPPKLPPPPPPPFSASAVPPPPVPGFADESGDPGLTMMRAMGWQEGTGLGSSGQGMMTPLVAQKTTSVSAVIVNAEERPRKPPPPPLPSPTDLAPGGAPVAIGGGVGATGEKKGPITFRGRPSRVLLLKNMVGPGEVDAELRNEIGEECSRFGEVVDVVVRELPAEIEVEAGGEGGAVRRLADDQRVRIFVKFSKQAVAMKAYIELDGRYFGGRRVWVCFFREADFDAGSFAPSAREPK